MNNLHKKSPCCGEKIWRINNKRRQCSCCRKTWSLWPKKAGRKKKRESFDKLFRYLSHYDGTSRQRALQDGLNVRTKQLNMQKLMLRYCRVTAWPEVPSGALIVVPDALLTSFNGEIWTLYCILLRPVNRNKAVITKPILLPGREGQNRGWYRAFNALPDEVHARIVGMTCDGAQSLTGMARRNDWYLQRCYFHLKARVRQYISTGPLGSNSEQGIRLQRLISTIVCSNSDKQIREALINLKSISDTGASKALKKVLTGFLRYNEEYRAYLKYPELNLPRTSNSAESLMGIIRRLERKVHGYSNTKSFEKWTETVCKYHKTITCNGTNHLQH